MDRWACMDCGGRQAEPGACVGCRQDPVLDLGDANVRSMLLEQDTQRRERRVDRLRYAAVPVSMVLVGLFLALGGAQIVPAGPFMSYWIGGMVVVGLGLMKLAERVVPFRARFGDLRP